MIVFRSKISSLINVFFILAFFVLNANAQVPAPGCPGIDLGPDTTISCNSPCITLNAEVLNVGLTNTYTVDTLPYAPPYPYNQGNAIFVNLDDVWSELISLPFNFCFFGNTYSDVVVGANGVLTFDYTLASPPACNWFNCTFCEWNFNQSLPNASGFPYRNSINGPYHDIDPSVGGSVKYAILGSYPCRTFVVNYENIPHFDCNNITTTQQIVFYETTNIIEVYVQNKPTCTGWNNGNAVIGIQNANGTTAFTPPNRNTGPWSAYNEAWRFTPNGNSITSIQWYDSAGNPIGTNNNLTVCPTSTSTYSAEVTYNRCDGSQVIETDQITVNLAGGGLPNVIANTSNNNVCIGDSVILSGSGALTYSWDNGVIDGVAFYPTSSNTYIVTGTDVNGCTNTDTISISVLNTTASSTPISSCVPITWNGQTYSSSGTYTYQTVNANGCDSIATLNLTINSVSTSSTPISSCVPITWNGQTYSNSGTYTYLTVNANGCDSIATLNLTITPTITSSETQSACKFYTWNGNNYFSSGTYTYQTVNANGCDSIAYLILTIYPSTSSTNNVSSCDSYFWNGNTFTSSGSYSFLTTNSNGCDSTAFLNLIIDYSTNSVNNISSCGSYTWNGQTYTSSGTYTSNLTNSNGCDSTATLNLSIIPIATSVTDSSTCSQNGILWNGQTYTNTGTYTFQTTGSNGCDSIATLNFTYNTTSTSTTNISSCEPYLWNSTVYDSSGTYTYLTNSISGCDSIATLNLIINSATSSWDSIISCDFYFWNGNNLTSSNNYTFLTTNVNGCDSVANLTLDIIEINLFFPNTFTPNNDDLNENFAEFDNEIIDYQIWIFNRWGEEIFYSNSSLKGWDGKFEEEISQDGIYAWRVVYKCGYEFKEETGLVTILK